MINPYLKSRLLPVWQRRRRWLLFSRAAAWLAVCALAGVCLKEFSPNGLAGRNLGLWAAGTAAGLVIVLLLWWFQKPDYQKLARRIEGRHPSLEGRLLTAVEISPAHEPEFIQERLLQQTIQHGLDHDWKNIVRPLPLDAVQAVSVLAAGACLALFVLAPESPPAVPPASAAADGVVLPDGVEIFPGDTEVEKGSALLVTARFTASVPGNVELVTGNTPESSNRKALVRNLNDPLFGGSVPDVKEDFRYRIDYDGKRTRDFSVRVFEYPKLERSDATLTYPAWTGLPEKRTEDTRRASAVEGSRLRLDLQLNKPVAAAVLQPRDKSAAAVPLVVEPGKAVAVLADFAMVTSQVYDLILTDDAKRTNQSPEVFTLDVLPNLPPRIQLATPRGDQRPSALEEMLFSGTVTDDFGVLAWGLSVTKGGGSEAVVELGRNAAAGAPAAFSHWLKLEEEKVKPDDLLSWYAWADDIGPDGKPRRTRTDLFFGEVRPFEEIFRQGEQASGGESPPPAGAGAGAGSPSAKLAELQKQIINATWKLQRDTAAPAADVGVVRDSQKDALAQATEASAEGGGDSRLSAAWESAKKAMTTAVGELESVVKNPAPLTSALSAEQAAYQALLALRARETRISKSKSPPGSGSAAEQQRQEELDEMELTKEENRYQLESEAKAPQEEAQREQRQVLSRLQELARRQEEVNEKLKELQTALQAENTPEKQAELQRELKRLEEEQRQMLADVDELNQRMEKPENQEALAQERKALEEARKNVQDSAKASAEGQVGQALSAGTRAQRQLQEMREDLRKKNSSAFNQELRDLRSEARDVARRQEKVTEQIQQLDQPNQPKQPSLESPPELDGARKELADQQERTKKLTKKAEALSESAEAAEPLVSRSLYDTMRKFAQEDAAGVKETQQKLLAEGRMTRQLMDDLSQLQQRKEGAKTLEMTSGLLEEDLLEEAKAGGKAAASGLDSLKSGIERAAEKVLGDDTEAIKRAERELDQLTRDLEKEIAQAGGAPGDPSLDPTNQKSGEPGGGRKQGDSNGEGQEKTSADSKEPTGETGNGEGAEKGQEDGKTQEPGDAKGKGEAEGKGIGEAKGAGAGAGEGKSAGAGKGAGEAKGEGEGKGAGEAPDDSKGEGQGKGEGQAEGEGQGQGQGQGQGEGEGEGEGKGQNAGGEGSPGANPGDSKSNKPASGKGREPGQAKPVGEPGGEGESQGDGEGEGGPGNPRGASGSRTAGGRGGSAAPMTGDGYAPWSDRLREVEEIVDFPDLRDSIATARERARQMRVEVKRDLKKPDWAVVRAEVMTPLVEVRQRLKEELARRNSTESLVPIDRDPVPGRFTESVRRYYEQLGKEP